MFTDSLTDRPDRFTRDAHIEHINLTVKLSEPVLWEWVSAYDINPLYKVHIYTATAGGTYAVQVHENYDELEVLPFPFAIDCTTSEIKDLAHEHCYRS